MITPISPVSRSVITPKRRRPQPRTKLWENSAQAKKEFREYREYHPDHPDNK